MKFFDLVGIIRFNITLLIPTIVIMSLLVGASCYGSSGKYLVASQAAGTRDFSYAAEQYLSILEKDYSDTLVIQEALIFSVLANDIDSAWRLSLIAEKKGFQIPSAGLIALAKSSKDQDFDKVQSLLKKYENALPKFLTSFALGWTEIATGNFKGGIKTFTSLEGTMRYLALYNCALAYAMNGNFIKAVFYINKLERKKLQFDELQLLAQAQIYSNNGENNKAILLLEKDNSKRNNNIFVNELRALKSGIRLKFDVFNNPSDALASIFNLMGSAGVENNRNSIASIFYIQLAAFMSDKKDYYNLQLADVFSQMQARSYSIAKYREVASGSTLYARAQLGLVDTLVDQDQDEKAMEVLENLIKQGFNDFEIFDSLADIFRAKEEYEMAIKYYDLALKNFSKETRTDKWATYFVRGIAHDQSGNWEQAKADFNKALELYPKHPEVLNYFGYSLIERNESLISALGMIEQAVTQKPESGYIVDSLAWGLFRLGQYKEAIVPMEKAIELEPSDPIVNDHLGDILWMIGRKREADFQWNRALLFGPTKENREKIEEKLLFGLKGL